MKRPVIHTAMAGWAEMVDVQESGCKRNAKFWRAFQILRIKVYRSLQKYEVCDSRSHGWLGRDCRWAGNLAQKKRLILVGFPDSANQSNCTTDFTSMKMPVIHKF